MSVANPEVVVDTGPRDRTTVTLTLSGDQVDALERMMGATKQNRAELVRRGLQLLGEELEIPFPIRLRVL